MITTSIYFLLCICFKYQVLKTRENFIITVEIDSQNVTISVNILNIRTVNEIDNRLPKPLKVKRTETKLCRYEKDSSL